MVGVGSQHFKN
jgi:hypothetical protein